VLGLGNTATFRAASESPENDTNHIGPRRGGPPVEGTGPPSRFFAPGLVKPSFTKPTGAEAGRPNPDFI
jgi:hypothetical protein